MNILLLAPHPFYQERGSPIAVNLLLRVLSERGDNVDVLVYHEGEEVRLPNVSLKRIPALPFIRRVPPGFSWKKLICDSLMLFSTARLAFRRRYDLVYAVEESVFISLLLKWAVRMPYVYDMDSRLSEQLSEQYGVLSSVAPVMRSLERIAMRNALAIVPVCHGLLTAQERQRMKKVVLLRDVSLLDDRTGNGAEQAALKTELDLQSACLLMYVGNLQAYQGIDLLLDGFALVAKLRADAHLAVIGGTELTISRYVEKANRLGIGSRAHFLGPRPVADLRQNLAQADILVSPRIKGSNTPMKLYSYLHSGTACLLTDVAAHNQVASDDIALLVKPSPKALSEGMLTLIDDENLRSSLGAAAKSFVERNNSFEAFARTANELFDWLRAEVAGDRAPL